MNFSVKSVLKRRHNYLIPFLFIFCARCIYKSSYTPPSHPNIQTRRSDCKSLWKSDRIGQKICVHLWIENRRPKGKPNLWEFMTWIPRWRVAGFHLLASYGLQGWRRRWACTCPWTPSRRWLRETVLRYVSEDCERHRNRKHRARCCRVRSADRYAASSSFCS